MKIYVAGASKELNMLASYVKKLREIGFTITHDWTADMLQDIANGHESDKSLPQETKLKYARLDYEGIQACDTIWMLVPENYSNGAWIELGMAIALEKHVVMSGSWQKSIFSELVSKRFETHEQAYLWLLEYSHE